MEIANWDKIDKQIDIVRDLREISSGIDEMKIWEIVARQVDGSTKAINKAKKYRMKFEIKGGEIYDNLESETINRYSSLPRVTSKKQAQSQIGKSRKTLNKWVKASNIENREELLNKYEAECNDKDEEMSSEGFINFNKIDTEHKKIEKRKISLYGDNIFFMSNKFQTSRPDSWFIIKDGDVWPTLKRRSWFFHEDMTEYSLREYARVQEFPDTFKFIGTYEKIKDQIGNAVPPTMAVEIGKELKGQTVGDLFCGCGGFSHGLEVCGKKIKWGVEWSSHAAITFEENHANAKIYNEDIKECDPLEFEKVDIIIGGPPCQGFSLSGKGFKDDPRNEYYKEFVRFVSMLQPKEFVMENVKSILQNKDEIIKDFEKENYDVEIKIIKGIDIGMRQRRERCFFMGVRK